MTLLDTFSVHITGMLLKRIPEKSTLMISLLVNALFKLKWSLSDVNLIVTLFM